MRPLKFRAWDVPNKRWMDEHSTYALMKECQITGHDYGFRYVIEQFTGLQDKHGKDIYEGDLIRNNAGRTCQVVWFKPCVGFDCEVVQTIPGDSSVGFSPSLWAGMVEVIGNIHSNPELLERK